MEGNNDYTKGNLLDYEYFSKHFKIIAINFSKQIELENFELKQQKILLASLIKIMEIQCSLLLKNHKKQLLNFTKCCNCYLI